MTVEAYGPTCPVAVRRAVMIQRWDQLTFVHWSYPAETVQALLPEGLEVESFDGRAWIGLVPFVMEVRLARGPALPWLSRFCETNVRTYVKAPDGTVGVWFLSLDAARLPAVIVARTTYHLPYFWSSMRVEREGDVMAYRSRRWWPGPRGASSDTVVRIGERLAADELDQRDHYLTARWRLYSHRRRAGLRSALAYHQPWPLHRAELLRCDDELVRAAGLPDPVGPPLVHWSPGVEVRIGTPSKVATS
jgi:uncharacterized protein